MCKALPRLATALSLALAACGTNTPATSPTSVALEAFKPIAASKRDTCETQKSVAEHNSAYDTLKTGKAVVYAAPCRVDKPTTKPPKTS